MSPQTRLLTSNRARLGLAAMGLGLVLACGSSGGSDAPPPSPPPPPPPPAVCSALPAVPGGVFIASQASQGVTLRWNAVTATSGCTIQYKVYQGETELTQVSGTRAMLTGLTPGTAYSFTVAAVNSFGTSAKSSALAHTTRAADVINPAIQIRTWVPPYSQNVWKAALTANTGGAYKPSNTLTSIGAQFFQIDNNGGVALAGPPLSDVQWVATYCATNNMKFLLCVTNYNGAIEDWDWPRAISAFETNKTALINNLVAAVGTYGADGINIDFEGIVDESVAHRPAFATFIRELGTALHAIDKELTVAVFPSQWNAPAITWANDWDGYVDGIESMGYDGLYGGASDTTWNSYTWQQVTAQAEGYTYGEFAMGMPGWLGTWGQGGLGTSVRDHLDELQCGRYNTQPTSICIWDAQFNGSGWLNAEVWQALHAIRTSPAP